ncbi:MAG: DEAD/DEAH box helicase [Synechococcales bacterium]|nr:DEAD/DEAH box helicase [Synechococcales bacterium]
MTDYRELDQKHLNLTAIYHKLLAAEKSILQFCSVLYEPITPVILGNALQQLSITQFDGQPFAAADLQSTLQFLVSKELLLRERNTAVSCNPAMVELFTREAVQTGMFEKMVEVSLHYSPVRTIWQGGAYLFSNYPQFIRVMRWGIYRQDFDFLTLQLASYQQHGYQRAPISLGGIVQRICNNPFDPDWCLSLSQPFLESILLEILDEGLNHLTPTQGAFDLLQTVCQQGHEHCSDVLLKLCAEHLLLRNRPREAETYLQRLDKTFQDNALPFWGWAQFLQGDIPAAIASFQAGLSHFHKNRQKRKSYFETLNGLFYIFALIKEGSPPSLQTAQKYADIAVRQKNHQFQSTYLALFQLLQVLQGSLGSKKLLLSSTLSSTEKNGGWDLIVTAFCIYWCDLEVAQKRLPDLLVKLANQANLAGMDWINLEAKSLLAQLDPKKVSQKALAQQRSELGVITLVNLVSTQEPWELCLNALSNLQKKVVAEASGSHTATARLVWFLTLQGNSYVLQPKEQKLNAQGHWSKGRSVALKRLKESVEEFNYLTPQDHQICSYLRLEYEYSGYYGGLSYCLDQKALIALIGHPLVFWEDLPDVRVEIVKGEPELLVKKIKGDRIILQLSPNITSETEIVFTKETPTRVRVIEITTEHHRIAEILGKKQLEVPESAQERVLNAIAAISSLVTVHSDIGGGMENVEEVPSDPKPHVHLLPADPGLKVAILSRPFNQGGSYYQPGSGGETVIAEINGKRLQTTRNLKKEKQLAKAFLNACSTLQEWESENNEWWIDDPECCLELLLELQNLGDQIVLEWPEGEKIRVRHHVDPGDFRISIKRHRDWFEASGGLQLDDETLLDMQVLFTLLDQSSGRFVKISNGEFIALTDALRKQLDEFQCFSEKYGKGVRFHSSAALTLEETLAGFDNVKTDKYWKELIQKFQAGESLQPQLPSTLQADLRDYQQEGFAWLSKLSAWGVGACLADDMGLGKTLQALALILTRATEGPSLVIAPTSVCMNWISEANRFTPTLNPIQFRSGDRQKILKNPQPFDLIICSYGFLQQEEVANMLANIQWQTIVLDEAQSIKNFATKRSQAAMKLQAGFKIITTGTPIENHLGELWNLFRFINPGLLGSLESFNERFAIPIERSQDKAARHRLKRLIQPFILRRTKNQVLAELPSRTEILLQVELSHEEKAFYEALRREAIVKLSESELDASSKRLQMLAEIMRLRQACCNPRLVKPNIKIESSKLGLFGEVLEELLENKHKALVFSQFVDHLTMIREYLDKKKISYQYLDGNTTAHDRQKRVKAFQAGEGDVFLISLKAGGTGLNLTAADYVIHMDPWWNPAVEDQASDRAHRIGQKRPVTIYRLVAQGTIEEKIVALHQDKRDLANSLLEGTEMSGKISTEELIRLIQEG